MHDRFFESTRGKIVTALRQRRSASAHDLAGALGVSANAVRQQLVVLERDGVVAGRSVRRGRTKPTVEFSLTAGADRYFPQRYDKMLNAVLREIRAAGGDEAVQAVFERVGRRTAERLEPQISTSPSTEARIATVADALRASGTSVEVRREGETLVLHEHACPYASVVAEHPEACTAIHTILDRAAPGAATHVESIATGGSECRFEIAMSPTRASTES